MKPLRITALACAVGIQRVSGENADADKSENRCRNLNHRPASCVPIAAGDLARDWFHMRWRMSRMVASLFY